MAKRLADTGQDHRRPFNGAPKRRENLAKYGRTEVTCQQKPLFCSEIVTNNNFLGRIAARRLAGRCACGWLLVSFNPATKCARS